MNRVRTPNGAVPRVGWMLALASLSLGPWRPAHAAQQQAGDRAEAASSPTSGEVAHPRRIVEDGASVTLSLEPMAGADAPLREREDIRLALDIADAATGEPLAGLFPAAWIDLRRTRGPTPPDACGNKVESYVGGRLRFRPEVDLTSYRLLALTNTSQIPVIDPMVGFGTSRLYTTILLPAPGADWALGPEERALFVSVPSEGVISVVDTETWKVVENLEAGGAPTRVRRSPDGSRLWVTDDADDGGGVIVVDAVERVVAGRIATGAGPHEIAFAPALERAYVANGGDGTVSVIDTRTLEEVDAVWTGDGPVDLAYSSATNTVHVAHEGDGALVALDARTLDERGRLEFRPGLYAVAFIPPSSGGHGHGHGRGVVDAMAGRIGFLVNRREDRVHVFEAHNPRLLRTVEVFDSPDQIAFTSSFAYIRAAGSAQVTMIPLNDPTSGGIGVFDHFPAGARAPAEVGDVGVASAIAPAPDMPDAVWIVNPDEQAVYYYHYMEGMPTPSGSLDTYGFDPLAVKLIGRELRETTPGRYTATVRLDEPGDYDLVLLAGEPRIVHCFGFTVLANAALGGEDRLALRLEPLDGRRFEPGPVRARFRLLDGYTGEAVAGAEDLRFTVMATNGWHRRVIAEAGEDGVYELRVTLPAAGVYYLSFASPSLGVTARDRPPIVLRATGATGGRR